MGTQGFRELGGLLAAPEIQIVAVCDPNTDSSDYVEWGKNGIRNEIRAYLGKPTWRENDGGCPGGREVGREVVDTYYAKQRGADSFKACAAYADFRELLEKEKDLDAVKIMTPDHLHATIAIAAMNKGKHVLMHKPIANRMYEARLVIATAGRKKVATHLMAYGLGTGNALIATQIQEGAIGTLREVHNWTNRPVWPQYTEIPTESRRSRRASIGIYGSGRHSIVLIIRTTRTRYFAAGTILAAAPWPTWEFTVCGRYSWPRPGVPQSAEAWATHTCSIVDQISRAGEERFFVSDRLHHPFAVRTAAGHAGPRSVLVRWRDETASARGNRGAERGSADRRHPVCRRPGSDHGRVPRAKPAAVRQGHDGPLGRTTLRGRAQNGEKGVQRR